MKKDDQNSLKLPGASGLPKQAGRSEEKISSGAENRTNRAWARTSASAVPFALTALIVGLDQFSKALIASKLKLYEIGVSLFGGFLRIIHVRNPGIAFSLGSDFPDFFRGLLFTVLPVLVLIFLVIYYFKSEDLSRLQRWAVAGVIGGGIGNLIDRIFRPLGVVDFIDVRFFGLFGLDRWPTFNVADSSVVVCGLLLILTFFLRERRNDE